MVKMLDEISHWYLSRELGELNVLAICSIAYAFGLVLGTFAGVKWLLRSMSSSRRDYLAIVAAGVVALPAAALGCYLIFVVVTNNASYFKTRSFPPMMLVFSGIQVGLLARYR